MRLFLATVLVMTSLSAFAEAPYVGRIDAASQPRFQLNYQSELVAQNTTDSKDTYITAQTDLSSTTRSASYFVGSLKRYDATWLYPVSQSAGMNVDLGVNLRYLDGQVAVASSQGRVLQNYRSAIPMFYASALFDLPFKGLTARVDGGSQIDVQWDNLFTSFDYKAAIRYDWDNGLGLEGGWQQRQWQLDNQGNAENRIESKGLYLDLKLKF